MIDNYPTIPVRLLAFQAIGVEDITYTVDLGNYVQVDFVSFVYTGGDDVSQATFILTVAGIKFLQGTFSGGVIEATIGPLYGAIAHDSETIEVNFLEDFNDCTVDVMIWGRITAKRSFVT